MRRRFQRGPKGTAWEIPARPAGEPGRRQSRGVREAFLPADEFRQAQEYTAPKEPAAHEAFFVKAFSGGATRCLGSLLRGFFGQSEGALDRDFVSRGGRS